MKIYEITSRTPNEQLINRELINLSKAVSKITERSLYENAASDALPAAAASPGVFSRLGSAIMSLAKIATWGFILKPFWDFYQNMKTASDNLKDSKSPDAEKKYNEEVVTQVGMLVAAIAAGLLTKGIFSTVTGFLGFIRYVPFIGPIISKIIGFLSTGAQLYVLKELTSQEGRTQIANIVSGTILGEHFDVKDIGTLVIAGVNYFTKLINDAIDHDAGKKSEEPKLNDTTADATSTTDANTPTETPVAPTATEKWELPQGANYTPAGMYRDKAGRLSMNPQ